MSYQPGIGPDGEGFGYSYEPFEDKGPYADYLRDASRVVGATLGSWVPGPKPLQLTMAVLGDRVGAEVGGSVGSVIDNLPVIERNLDTFMEELNDPRSWMAFPGGGPF